MVYDPERKLDPGNTAGIYYGQIDVGCDMRLRFGGRQVFIGRIADAQPRVPVLGRGRGRDRDDPGDGLPGQAGADPGPGPISDRFYDGWPDEITNIRVNRILDACEVPAADRDIEAGGQKHHGHGL